MVSGFGHDATGEIKTLRALEALHAQPIDLAPIFFGGNSIPDDVSPETFAREVLAPLAQVVARRRLSGIAAVRCGPCAFDVESARPYLFAARENGLRRAIYSHQFAPDDSVRMAVDMEALSVTHLEHIRDGDVSLLANSDTFAVLTPAATFHMGLTRFAPARQLIDEGAAVALATAYGPDQNPTFSMPFTIMLACRYLGMSPAEAVTAATINAAHALGLGDSTGSIEPGEQADILNPQRARLSRATGDAGPESGAHNDQVRTSRLKVAPPKRNPSPTHQQSDVRVGVFAPATARGLFNLTVSRTR